MTVTTTDRRAGPFYGNGVTTQFPFTFKVFSAADLEVTYTNAAGVASVITSGFTVTLNADQDANPGGYITYPLSGSPMASPASLVAIGATAYSQPAAFSNVGRFLPEVHERAFDRQAILSQQLAEKLGRQLTIPPDGPFPVTALPTRAARYDRLLCFADLSGQPNVTPFTATQVASAIAAAYSGAVGPLDAQSFIANLPGAVTRTAQAKVRDVLDVRDVGITPDGITNHTTALVTLLSALGAATFRGWIEIPYNTLFDVETVYAAVPTGVMLDDESSINWGQPPSYKNKFRIMYSGDTVSDDTQSIVGSPHNPALMLLNFGTAGSFSATNRLATLLHGVGKDYAGDPMLGWLQQFGRDSVTNRWRVSWRVQTPCAVALANPQEWTTATVYAAGAYCISDGGKVYKTTAGGTSGASAPTGTGTVSDGAVTWVYQQAALNIDSTRMDLDEAGNFGMYGPGTLRWTMQAGIGTHETYLEYNTNTNDLIWRDSRRSLDVLRVSTAAGLSLGMPMSLRFAAATGATPTVATCAMYLTQAGATTVTNFTLPAGQSDGDLIVLFGDANTTINHGGNFSLKGGTNIAPVPVNAIMRFVRYSSHSSAWIEMSRNF